MNWKTVKSALIPVALGFVVVALVLGILKSRFGIEIGDPPELEESSPTTQPTDSASA